MAQCVENVSKRGARRRAAAGWAFLAMSVAMAVAFVVVQPPRLYRLLLGIPIGVAALNFIEAREKT